MSIFIDSSIWIDWLRNRKDPREFIKPWLLRRECFTCGIVRFEVTRGIIHQKQKEKIENLFDAMENINLDYTFWQKATTLAWSLDRKGKILPLSDIVIAECSRISKSWLVTLDSDFKKIPGIKIRSSIPKMQ